MFERYTEKARRVIFFGRYEASQLASGYIETEHLLLALVREDTLLLRHLPSGAQESIRRQVAELRPSDGKKIETSIDLPLSSDSKRALALATEESEALGHKFINPGHLVLGLLRVPDCLAAQVLREHGIECDSYREVVRHAGHAEAAAGGVIEKVEKTRERAPIEVKAPSVAEPTRKLNALIDQVTKRLDGWTDVEGAHALKRYPWTRKEGLGHLVDWATTHQRWFARALTEPNMVARFYPQDEWVSAQQYAGFGWQELVDLWVCLNRFLVHVLAIIPEEKLATSCKIGLHDPLPLMRLIESYVEHCEDVLGQILTHG